MHRHDSSAKCVIAPLTNPDGRAHAGPNIFTCAVTESDFHSHAGTYGVKTPYHPVAMKIGKPVFKAMARDEPDFISSDCALAGHHIAQGMAQAGTSAKALQHPLSLVRHAYGL